LESDGTKPQLKVLSFPSSDNEEEKEELITEITGVIRSDGVVCAIMHTEEEGLQLALNVSFAAAVAMFGLGQEAARGAFLEEVFGIEQDDE